MKKLVVWYLLALPTKECLELDKKRNVAKGVTGENRIVESRLAPEPRSVALVNILPEGQDGVKTSLTGVDPNCFEVYESHETRTFKKAELPKPPPPAPPPPEPLKEDPLKKKIAEDAKRKAEKKP